MSPMSVLVEVDMPTIASGGATSEVVLVTHCGQQAGWMIQKAICSMSE